MSDPRVGAIRALLDAHRPDSALETGHLDEMRALIGTPAPFSRDQFDPGHLTASAFVTSAGGTELLLVHHAKLDLWIQPGGHFELGDVDLWGAARREIAEETGLDALDLPDGPVLLDIDIHEIPALRGEPPHRHYDLRVHLRCTSPLAQATAGPGTKAVRWVPLASGAEGWGLRTDASVARAARRLLR